MSRPSFTAEELENIARHCDWQASTGSKELTEDWQSARDACAFAAECVRDRVEDKRALTTAQLQLQHVTLTLEQLLGTLRDVKSPQV